LPCSPSQRRPRLGRRASGRLNDEGSAGPLDLVANVNAGGLQGFWHQQVLPRLQLVGSSRTSGKGRVVTFRVLDAGDPVAAATVRAGGRTPRTSAKGTATLRQARSVRVQATASKTGFASSAAITVPSRTSLRSQVRAALVRSRPRP